MANAVSAVAVNERCVKVFEELRDARAHRFVVYRMTEDFKQVVVKYVGEADSTLDDLLAALPDSEPRYAVYDLEFIADDDTPGRMIFFISWQPDGARPRSKAVYASSKEGFKKVLEGVQYDLEATDASELTLDILKAHAT